MAGFTTTNDGEWEFSFDDTPSIPDLPVHDPHEQQGPEAPGYLDGPGKWENYSDLVIYELEALLRKWFTMKIESGVWDNDKTGRRRKYTCKMMYEQLYGKLPDLKDQGDRVKLRRLPKVLSYYSTRIQASGSINGKKMTKTIYTLSPKLYKTRPPYSLRLRLQWLAEKGELPTWHNMMLPRDDLKIGHARNKRTDENMELRRERAKQRYNERYADRAH